METERLTAIAEAAPCVDQAVLVRSCGICGGRSGIGTGFLRVLQPVMSIVIPHSSSGAGTIGQWIRSHHSPRNPIATSSWLSDCIVPPRSKSIAGQNCMCRSGNRHCRCRMQRPSRGERPCILVLTSSREISNASGEMKTGHWQQHYDRRSCHGRPGAACLGYPHCKEYVGTLREFDDMEFDAVWFGLNVPTLGRNLLPQSSGRRNVPCKIIIRVWGITSELPLQLSQA
jgi:hypothetical protein